MDKISLHRMTFNGYHGVFPEERKLGQRFIVDVDLYLDLKSAGRSDDLAKTIHYAEVYEQIRRIAEGEPYKLLRRSVNKLLSRCLMHIQKSSRSPSK